MPAGVAAGKFLFVNFGADFASASPSKKVRTLDEWASRNSVGKKPDPEPSDSVPQQPKPAGADPVPHVPAKPKPEPEEGKTGVPKDPKPENDGMAQKTETATGDDSMKDLSTNICSKGIVLKAASDGSLWASISPDSNDGQGKKIPGHTILWHSRDGKLKTTSQEGLLRYNDLQDTGKSMICFSKKGEIFGPKKLAEYLDDAGIKVMLHFGEWTSQKAPASLTPPSAAMAFAPADNATLVMLKNVLAMSQAGA